jgi:hypothetical protein
MSDAVLRIADLRAALGLALDAVEAEQGDDIVIAHDHYWHLPVETSFDLSREPTDLTDLTVGQVSDDLAEVRSLLGGAEAEPAWHAISHVIGLLRLVEDAVRP